MEHRIGRHTLREDGETLHLRIIGDFEMEEMQQVLSIIDSVVEREGCWAVVADVREMSRVTHEARQLASRWENVKLGYATAIFGAGLATRTMIFLISRAMELITRKHSNITFVKTEAEARSWVKAQRRFSS